MLAIVRPAEWNLPLLLHVLGAMLLVGTLLVAVLAFAYGWRRDDAQQAITLNRLGWWTLLIGVLPSYVLMRIAAQWIYAEEFGDAGDDPGWVAIGYITTDLGALLLLIALIAAGIGARRIRRREGTSSALSRVAAVIAGLMLIAYLVAVWAMTVKPD